MATACDEIVTELEFASGLPVSLENNNGVEIPKHLDVGEYDNEQLDAIEIECTRRMLSMNDYTTGRTRINGTFTKAVASMITVPNGYTLVQEDGGNR